MLWLGKCPFGEMSQWGNVQPGKYPLGKCRFGELPVRGNVRRGSVSRGFVLGELSVGEVPGRETVLQSSYHQFLYIFISYFYRKNKTTFLFISSTICNPVGPCLPYLTLLLTITLNKVNGVLLGCIIVEEIKKSWLSR